MLNSEKIELKGNTKIGDIQMTVRKKKIAKTLTSTTIVPTKTYKNMKRDIKELTWVNYDEMREFVKQHEKELFKKGKRYVVEVLTEVGWRGGKDTRIFSYGEENIDWYDPEIFYGDNDEVDIVGAIQIQEISKPK